MSGWLSRFFTQEPVTPVSRVQPDRAVTRADETYEKDGAHYEFEQPFLWAEIPHIHTRHSGLTRGGNPDLYKNSLDYALMRWGGKIAANGLSALVLGTESHPDAAEWLAACGRFDKIVILDHNEAMLRGIVAKRLAGVECLHGELSAVSVPAGEFDLIVTDYALQGCQDVTLVVSLLQERLKRGGLLVAREYTGPSRFQYTPIQMKLAEALFSLLPDKLRRDNRARMRDQVVRPGLSEAMNHDPNNAVNSDSVLAELRKRFKILESVPLGGTLLAPLLAGLADGFAASDEVAGLLDTLMDVEMRLIDGQAIPSDYFFLIARHPAS